MLATVLRQSVTTGLFGRARNSGPEEHNPRLKVVAEGLEAMRYVRSDEQKISGLKGDHFVGTVERTATRGDEIELVAVMRLLRVDLAWREQLKRHTVSLEQFDKRQRLRRERGAQLFMRNLRGLDSAMFVSLGPSTVASPGRDRTRQFTSAAPIGAHRTPHVPPSVLALQLRT